MKSHLLTPAALLAAALAVSTPARAESLVFEIGTFDNSQAEFEQESDSYNDHQFYYEPGDYSATPGNNVSGGEYELGLEVTDPEILSDGPLAGEEHPWADTLDGFPRAVVPGRPVIDIFFQLTESEAASSALKFETLLMWLGEGSSHDLTFYINNVPFHRLINVRTDTPVEVYIPRNLPTPEGHPGLFQVGPNCLSIRRSGGGSTNPWIQFDALRLTAEVTAPTELIWQAGWFDGGAAEFEAEWDAYTDPRFYVHPGDYTDTVGRASPGVVFEGPGGEIWQDGPDEIDPEDPEGQHTWARTLDGFPRAVTAWRPTIDIYFKLTAEQAQQEYLAFHTALFGLGGNSTHDLMAYFNGVPIAIGLNISGPRQVDVIIPRRDVRGAGYGPVFREGNNVLSLCRTGGGFVDPDLEQDEPWIQFDAVSLTTVAAVPEDVNAYRTVFSIGYNNNSVAEFEQESGDYNDPQYYAAPGDYSAVEGQSGWGIEWEGPEAEIWQDGPDNWNETLDGFPRALIKQEWGRPIIDIFFQEPGTNAERYLFRTWFFNPGGNGETGETSSHDVEFYLNGELFHTETEITNRSFTETWRVAPNGAYISAVLPAAAVKSGANVLSMVRSGGSTDGFAWVVIDYVELLAEAGEAVAPLPDFAVTRVSRSEAGAVTVEWASVAGAVYTVQASNSLTTGGWTDVATDLAGLAGTTSWTETTLPADTTHRYYRVVRTR